MKPIHAPILLGAILLLSSCGSPDVITISETRALPVDEQELKLDATDQDRFRVAMMIAGLPQQGQNRPAANPSGDGPRLAWDVPEGWEDLGASGMREADFRFGEEAEGEVYVTRAMGSVADNVNRWRAQMGEDPITDQEVEALPKRSIFGMPGVEVSIDGDFTGMGQPSAQEDYRMRGVILPVSEISLFVKMVGPRELVEANEDAFSEFCSSLRIES